MPFRSSNGKNFSSSTSIKPLDRIKIIEFLHDVTEGKIVEKIKIDDARQEELNIDRVLAENFTDEELVEMVKNMYQKDNNKGEN